MKTIKTILYTLAGVLIATIGFLIGERVSNFTVPTGKILVDVSIIDSLKNIPPEIIYHTDTVETIIYKDRLIPTPEPTKDTTIFKYTDHIENAYSSVIIRDWIRGELIDRKVEFTPYIVTKTVKEPYAVYIKGEAEKRKATLQAFAGLKVSRRPGIEIGLTTEKYYLSGSYDGYFGLTLGRKFNIY